SSSPIITLSLVVSISDSFLTPPSTVVSLSVDSFDSSMLPRAALARASRSISGLGMSQTILTSMIGLDVTLQFLFARVEALAVVNLAGESALRGAVFQHVEGQIAT